MTPKQEFSIHEVGRSGSVSQRDDVVAVEEPMEIRIVYGPESQRVMRVVSVTMRTPGHDTELAIGFLFSEGLLQCRDQVQRVEMRGTDESGQETGNVIRIALHSDVAFDPSTIQRNFLSNSSCGVCGKSSMESIHASGIEPFTLRETALAITPDRIRALPDLLRRRQAVFESTGGIHGSGLFDASGTIQLVREDVGRHNAVDKLIGARVLEGLTRLPNLGMVVSGRVSFEILQKALVAGLPMIVAVGAPSSLAVETARRYNLTLIGFTDRERFNIYAAPERVLDVRPGAIETP